MTDKELIKALECCGNTTDTAMSCAECPKCDEPFGCSKDLCLQAINLINRQKAEIERLLHSNKLLEKDVADGKMELSEFKAMTVDKVASMAIKAFAKRLKRIITISEEQKIYFDNLVKEMTE